jgi:hypothetical protein
VFQAMSALTMNCRTRGCIITEKSSGFGFQTSPVVDGRPTLKPTFMSDYATINGWLGGMGCKLLCMLSCTIQNHKQHNIHRVRDSQSIGEKK